MSSLNLSIILSARADALRAGLREAERALNNLSGVSRETAQAMSTALSKLDKIEIFKAQKSSLTDMKAAFQAAKDKVTQLNAAISAAGVPTQAQARDLAAATREVNAMRTALSNQRAALQQTVGDLNAMGLNTRRLAADERALRAEIEATAAAANRQHNQSNAANMRQTQTQSAANTLGVRLPTQITNDLAAAQNAYRVLAQSGQLSAAQLSGAHAQMQRQAAALRGELQGMNTNAQAAAGGMSLLKIAIGTIVVGAGLMAVNKALHEMVATGGEFERLRIQITGLAGSAAEGGVNFRWVEKLAKEAPQSMQTITKAFVTMKGYGLDPMNGSLQAMIDTSAKAGGTQDQLSRAVVALGQAWGKQQFMATEAHQFVDAGIPIWQYLGDALHKTRAELNDMSLAGTIGREEIKKLIEWMGKVNAGAATAQMKIWTGAISNSGDAIDKLYDSIASAGILDALTKEVLRFNDAIFEMEKSGELGTLAKKISNGLIEALDVTKSFAKTLYDLRDPLITLGELFLAIKTVSFVQAMVLAAASIGGITAAIGEMTIASGAFLLTPIGAAIGLVAIAGVAAYREMSASAQEAADEQKKLVENFERIRKLQDEMRESQLSLAQKGGSKELQDGINKIALAWKNGALTQAQAKEQTLDYSAKALVLLNEQIAQEKQFSEKTVEFERTRAAEAKKAAKEVLEAKVKAAEKLQSELESALQQSYKKEVDLAKKVKELHGETLKAKLDESDKVIKAKTKEVDESIKEETRLNDKIKELKEKLLTDESSANDKIRAINRRGMNEQSQDLDKSRQAIEKFEGARNALSQGDAKLAQRYAQEGESLAMETKNNNLAVEAVIERARIDQQVTQQEIINTQEKAQANAKALTEQRRLQVEAVATEKALKQEQIKAAEAEVKAQAASTATLKAQIAESKQGVTELQSEIKKLEDAPASVKVEAEISAAKTALASIQIQLNDLAKGVTVPIRMVETRSTGGTVGTPAGYQSGGVIGALPAFAQGGLTNLTGGGFMPGYGGGDRRLVLVEDGEIVIRKERTAQFYPLLHAINYASTARASSLVANLPAFKSGGLINGLHIPALSPAATAHGLRSPENNEVVNVNFSLNHKPTASLFGSRDQAANLVRAMEELQRGVVA